MAKFIHDRRAGNFKRFVFNHRTLAILLIKIAIISSAFLFAFLLRFDFRMPDHYRSIFLKLLPALVAIKLTAFLTMKMNRSWWRYSSMNDVLDILKANIVASFGFFLFTAVFHYFEMIPRSVLLIDGVLCFLISCGFRFATRIFCENYFNKPSFNSRELTRTLIVGAGNAGQMIIREIRQNPSLKKLVIGFIDDDPLKAKKQFQGIPVLGTQEDIAEICRKQAIQEVIIAIPTASGNDLRTIIERCQYAGIKFKTVPSVGDLIDGKISASQIKEVDVQDLLGRKPVRLDIESIKNYLQGKKILITGAAGSIGSEICRQVSRFNPHQMVIFDNAETPLFYIERELSERFPDMNLTPIIGDIRDRARVERIFEEFRPEVVFHAAAYKHVPMMEYNPAAAANNNVRGTRIVADAAHSFGTGNFVMVSTDKAVNPTNIMGTTKRAAELYVQNLSRYSRTQFVTVRFGNVLGSAGSVIPIFKAQIKKGGPVKVTHPDITRFFMTIPEATQLVLQAGSMGKGGEIFLLDMGDAVKIVHLAEELIRLSGFQPYKDINIVFTGLRPGEKLYEELLLAGEGVRPTSHEKIKVAQATYRDWYTLNQQLEDLYQSSRAIDIEAVIAKLKEIVPEYQHSVVKNWKLVQKQKTKLYVIPKSQKTSESIVNPIPAAQAAN
ncbi:MAG: polysaccharide biosynthesis protein [Desulfobacterales bacterium]|nr:polysaccharide biosynthesis protein [Desulfobacterales bacterium]